VPRRSCNPAPSRKFAAILCHGWLSGEGRKPWIREDMEATNEQGLHVSVLEPNALTQLQKEVVGKEATGAVKVVLWENIKDNPPKAVGGGWRCDCWRKWEVCCNSILNRIARQHQTESQIGRETRRKDLHFGFRNGGASFSFYYHGGCV
jgi:hypothetical protein